MQIRINTQVIFDLAVTTFFVLFSISIIKLVIPDGFNAKFLMLAYKFIGGLFIIINIVFVISWLFNRKFELKQKFSLPDLKNLILVALPLSPVIDYGLINLEYLNLNGWLYLIVTTLSFILFFSFFLPIIFSYFASFTMLMFSGLFLTFIILNMAKISNIHSPGDYIFSNKILLEGAFIIILFSVCYGLFLFNKTTAYISVLIFTITGISISINNIYLKKSTNIFPEHNNNKRLSYLIDKDKKIRNKRNVYILVYESYANLETLQYYGFDNSEHINFLKRNGFKTYQGVYSNSSSSIGTMSRILEMEGNLKRDGRYYISGNGLSSKIFKANGYKTIGIFKSSYFFGSSPIKWDIYYPEENVTKIGGKTLTYSIFEGRFRFNIFDKNFNYSKYLESKEKHLVSNEPNKFFYTHNNFPGHSQNSGKCRSNEKELYFEKMETANIEMKNDVSNIIKNDKSAIIVLLSDHGPFLTKNCFTLENYDVKTINKYDIQDRYGTFLSIHWPRDMLDFQHNIVITQDIVPAILSNLTNNKNLFNELKIEGKLFDKFKIITGGVNVINGIVHGGKDDGKPLFDKRSYSIIK